MDKVLITGGAGFIGSAIVPQLQRRGYDVYVIDDLSFGTREFISVDDDKFFQVDIREYEKIQSLMDKIQPSVIVHLAAIHFIPFCNQHPFLASEINISGTLNIINAAKKTGGLRKMFFASTAAVYPIYDEMVSEQFKFGPMDIYGLSKLTGEVFMEKFYNETGVDTVICRFFNAFGPNETNPHLIPEIDKQLKAGLRKIELGNLTPKRDFIHTYDMANAVEKVLEPNVKGFEIFNLGRGIEYSVVEVVEAFERQLGEKIEISVSPERVRKVERMHLLADVRKLKAKTGWEPVWTLDQGIADMIKNW